MPMMGVIARKWPRTQLLVVALMATALTKVKNIRAEKTSMAQGYVSNIMKPPTIRHSTPALE